MVAGVARLDRADDGRYRASGRWPGADRRRYLPMAAGEAGLPALLPRTAVVRAAARRLSIYPARLAATRCAARSRLHRLLLGADAAAVRLRRDESHLDRRAHDLRIVGEGD